MKLNFNLGLAVFGLVLGLAMLATPSSAEAQCYGNGFNYGTTYGYTYAAPAYGYYTSNYAVAPVYGYGNQGLYSGWGYTNPRAVRVRRAIAVAAVAGIVVAAANSNGRNRHRW